MNNIKKSILSLTAVAFLASCSSLSKMEKNIDDVKYNVKPNPLEVHGGTVKLAIDGYFPEKYFDKKAILTLTPILTYEGGEVAFDEVVLQGEKVTQNNTAIVYKTGGKFDYSASLEYKPAYEYSDLVLQIKGVKGNKERVFERIEIGKGVIATPYLVQSNDRYIDMPHGFTRITKEQQQAQYNFKVNSSYISNSEKRDADIKALETFADSVKANKKVTVRGVVIESHASPEGELRLNENLAEDRGISSKKALERLFRNKIEDDQDQFYNLLAKGEDWLGFKELMEKSNIEDKALILRILTIEKDLKKREQEIRNLSKTFIEIEDEILPKLRRSQITVNYDLLGKSDAEILNLAKSNAFDLELREILYAATLVEDASKKESILKSATEVYPTETAAFNNYAVILAKNGKIQEAKNALDKALKLTDNVYAHNNLGVILRKEDNNLIGAKDEYSKATSLGQDVAYNIGIVNILQGEYQNAKTNFGSESNFNKALAVTLNGNTDAALKAINEVASVKESAEIYYLQAVVHAKAKSETEAVTSLEKAFARDASLKEKARKDRSFTYIKNSAAFQQVVK